MKNNLFKIIRLLGLFFVLFTSAGSGFLYAVTDPYQDVFEDEAMKDVLMRRIANDPDSAGDPVFPFTYKDGGGVDTPDYPGFGTTPPGFKFPLGGNQPAGKFFPASNASQLDAYFTDIAKKIKLRLID